jgi:hypothetical protein
MNIVSRAIDLAVVARPEGEVRMDQRKPAMPAQASEMSRRDAARSGRPVPAEGAVGRAPTPAVDQIISRQLRAIYDEVVSEPIPDRFVQLLEELDRKKADKS